MHDEVEFYNEIAPTLRSCDPDIGIPRCFYANKGEGLIIMEDLKRLGFAVVPWGERGRVKPYSSILYVVSHSLYSYSSVNGAGGIGTEATSQVRKVIFNRLIEF